MTLPLTQLLLDHRAKGKQITELPAELIPADKETAYAVQNEVVRALGAVGAWKVQPLPETGLPLAAPLLKSDVYTDGAKLSAAKLPEAALEAEIAVTMGQDLTGKAGGYTADDLRAAVSSYHLAIEILSSRFVNRTQQAPLAGVADMQSNAAIVLGAPLATELPELGTQVLRLLVDGQEIGKVETGPTTENLFASLVWLANHAIERGFPLKDGDVIITGARIGALPHPGGTVVTVEGPGFSSVSASIE